MEMPLPREQPVPEGVDLAQVGLDAPPKPPCSLGLVFRWTLLMHPDVLFVPLNFLFMLACALSLFLLA